jgi:uncharacterized protein (TIGR02449 family)
MTESEINTLESQIDTFVKSYQRLSLENSSMRKKMTTLSNEYSSLLDKKKKVAESLKKIIAQLKDELL